MQIYKVFIKNFFILIRDCANKTSLEDFSLLSSSFLDSKFFKNQNDMKRISSIALLMEYLNKNSYNLTHNVFVSSKNSHINFNAFKKNFSFIIAAGGVVLNERDEILMIYKNNIWDLPKGKKNNSESDLIAAIREVHEETNVRVCDVKDVSFSTYHIYSYANNLYKKNKILKETRWFLMYASSQEKLIPQFEESIQNVAWFSRSQLKNLNIYSSLKSVFNHFLS